MRLGPRRRDHADPALRDDDLGLGPPDTDGTAWYHPMRLTIDSGAVADGNANPAQKVLDVDAIHGNDIHVPMYAFAAALGGRPGRAGDARRSPGSRTCRRAT